MTERDSSMGETRRAERCATRQNGVVTDVVRKGQLLVATPSLHEPTFARTVIALLEHDDENGSVGVVLNRPMTVAVAEVVDAVTDLVTSPTTLFDGGPVAPTTAIALGRVAPGAEPDGWTYVVPPLVTVDLAHDPSLLAVSVRDLRVFVGYAGWSTGQLAGEIEEGAWYVVEGLPADAFGPDPESLWSAVLRRQGWPLSAVAVCPLDPTMN
jgi:putative transcriptional regulator